jgi:hypothetical protein
MITTLIEKYHLTPKKVFLIDGLGALSSAVLLVFMVSNFESSFGLPKDTVYLLSIPAFALTGYSLSCYLLNLKKWKLYLKVVVMANSLYCVLTFCSLIWHYETIKIIGLMYFVGEIIIIYLIIRLEWLTIQNERNYRRNDLT